MAVKRDKMILNYSLLGKLTDKGKSLKDEAFGITKNTSYSSMEKLCLKQDLNLTFDPEVNVDLECDRRLTEFTYADPSLDGFMGYGVAKIADNYLSQVASTEFQDRLASAVLTREIYYDFVEK